MTHNVRIRYGRNVGKHFGGEVYVVTDAATAERLHPDADIVSYADGRPFDAKTDLSLMAVKEGMKAKGSTPSGKSKTSREKASG